MAQALYPKIAREAIANAERWSGLRPMTPDGPPVIGKTGKEPIAKPNQFSADAGDSQTSTLANPEIVEQIQERIHVDV